MSLNWTERLTAIGLSPADAQRKASAMKGIDAAAAWWIPGRIEFLGKHTDYVGGRSLLCATERGFCIAAVPTGDTVRIRAADTGATVQNVYTDAVLRRLTRNFGALEGADIFLWSDLPVAAGLSSSSALVVALTVIFIQLNSLDERPEWRASIADADALAEYLSCVENGFSFGALEGDRGVGTLSGSEDHTAITRSEAGKLIRYSFAPVQASGSVVIPVGHTFVVGCTGVIAEKSGSAQGAYNSLVQLAADALKLWNSSQSRIDRTLDAALDSSPDALDLMHDILKPQQYARVEQFHIESKILVPAAFEALERSDLVTLGRIVQRSQDAAENALGNQTPETSGLVSAARDLGAVAASAFGAGWGGSVWAMVASHDAPTFMDAWKVWYQKAHPDREGIFFTTRAASAARRLV